LSLSTSMTPARPLFVWASGFLFCFILFPNILKERKGLGGGGEVTENKMCLIVSTTFVHKTLLIPRITQRDIIINDHKSSRKLRAFLVGFESKLNFLGQFSENPKTPISLKSVQWEPSCSIRTDGQT